MGDQPSERMWFTMKRLAKTEDREITVKQAVERVRDIARREGAGQLPERALRFYAAEYLAMVKLPRSEN